MDNDKQAALSSGTWIRNRTKRYVEDDFALSLTPPTCEEGSFFSHYAKKKQQSKLPMYDSINQELNSVEKPTTSLIGKERPTCLASDQFLTSLSINSTGVHLEKERSPTSEKPKIFFPSSKDDSELPVLLLSATADSDSADTFDEPIKSAGPSSLNKSFAGKGLAKSPSSGSIFDYFNNVSKQSAINAEDGLNAQSASKSLSSSRQNLTEMADKQNEGWSVSKYFYTGKQLSVIGAAPAGSISAEINASIAAQSAQTTAASLDSTTKQLEEAARIAAEMQQLPAKVGKRRPKQTILREMNLWAPQSM